MIDVRVAADRLEIRLSGTDAVWALKRELDVPLGAVRDVAVVDVGIGRELQDYVRGLRLPGTLVPGLIIAGSYLQLRGRRWTFCCLRRGQRALVVDLEPAAVKYQRLLLGFDDPEPIRRRIETARRGSGV